MNKLQASLATPQAERAFGFAGKATEFRNSILAQGHSEFFDEAAGKIRFRVEGMKEMAIRAVSAEGGNRLSDFDVKRLNRLFPDTQTWFTSVEEARLVVDEVVTMIEDKKSILESQLGVDDTFLLPSGIRMRKIK